MSSEPSPGASEVRRYLVRLLIAIAVAAVTMVVVATLAWRHYARNFKDTTRPIPTQSAPGAQPSE